MAALGAVRLTLLLQLMHHGRRSCCCRLRDLSPRLVLKSERLVKGPARNCRRLSGSCNITGDGTCCCCTRVFGRQLPGRRALAVPELRHEQVQLGTLWARRTVRRVR